MLHIRQLAPLLWAIHGRRLRLLWVTQVALLASVVLTEFALIYLLSVQLAQRHSSMAPCRRPVRACRPRLCVHDLGCGGLGAE